MKSRRTVLMIALLGLCVASIAGCGGASTESLAAPPARRTAITSATPLVASQTTLDFGIVPQGGKQRLYFELQNYSDTAVDLDRVEQSCDCVGITFVNMRVQPGESVIALASLDLGHAPEFLGTLSIDVKGIQHATGTDKYDQVVLEFQITVNVREVADFRGLETDEIDTKRTSTVPGPVPMMEPKS